MAPKKKDAPKGKGGDDDEDNPAQLNAVLEAAVDSLKMALVLEHERIDKSASTVKEIT